MRNSDYIKLYADLYRLLEENIEYTMLEVDELEESFTNALKNVFETYRDENR